MTKEGRRMKNMMNKLENIEILSYYLFRGPSETEQVVTQLWDIKEEEDVEIMELLLSAYEQDLLPDIDKWLRRM